MRPGRFPKVNDVILAETLRQLIPVAESGVRASMTHNAAMAFRRAEMMLDMWTRQERGRIKKLGGPLPPTVRLEGILDEDQNNPDPGQGIPAECERPKPIRKKRATSAKSSLRHKFQWVMCETCNRKKVLLPDNTCDDCAQIVFTEDEISHELRFWKLLGNDVVYHKVYECAFRIKCDSGKLVAKSIYVKRPDQVLLESFEAVEATAVFAFLAGNGLIAALPQKERKVKRGRQFVM